MNPARVWMLAALFSAAVGGFLLGRYSFPAPSGDRSVANPSSLSSPVGSSAITVAPIEPGSLENAPIGPTSVDLEDAFCEGWASAGVRAEAYRHLRECIEGARLYESNPFFYDGTSVGSGDILGSNREGGFGWWWCELGPCVAPSSLGP